MREIFVSPADKAVIELGKQGESKATLVRFNLSKFVDMYGVGYAELLHIRRGEELAHPVPTVQVADELQWLVDTTDTEIPGVGYVELRYYVDDTLAKSVTWSVRVREALDAGDAPEPSADWFDQLAKLKAQIVEAFEKLKAFAADLKEKLERGDLDGFSPIAKVQRERNRAVITITDKEGTTTAEVYDGVPGEGVVGSINGVKPDATGAVTLTAEDLDAYTAEQTDEKIHALNQYVTKELGEVDEALEQREKTINKAAAITSSNVDESHYPSTKAMADYVATQVPTTEEKLTWNAKVDSEALSRTESTLRDEIAEAKKAIPTKLSDLSSDAAHHTVTDEQINAWNAKADTASVDTAKRELGEAIDTVDKKIPTTLSQLNADATHRTVTDEQINTWNAKVDTQALEETEQTLHNEIDAAKAAIPTKLSELAGDATHRTVTDEQIAAWDASGSGGIVVEIGSYQYVYKGKVLPAIAATVLATVYANDKAGIPQVLHWTLYGTENNLKVVSSDLIAGTYSIDVLVHNQFHCEYKWTTETTGNVNPTIMETEVNEATEEAAGVVALATQDDVAAGTNDTKAVTPKKLAAVYRDSDAQDAIDQALSDRIDRMETGAFPNATIVGEPLVVGANVSQFTNADYMIFPFVVDVRGKTFSIDFAFRTGEDVTTQQNILDSRFGLALAIRNGKGLMAMSSNGTSWDIGQSVGTYTIEPNSVYYARLAWDGTKYTTSLSTDDAEYVVDMTLNSSLGLHPETIYIGGAPDLFGTGTSHPFSGGIDMSYAKLTIQGNEVWKGMDTPGLASRANVSLSNLDPSGESRFTEIKEKIANKVSDVTVNGSSIVQDGVANIPTAASGYSSNRVYGVVAPYADSFSEYNGMLTVRNPTTGDITSRKSRAAITASRLDDAVKAALCDGVGAAWTDAEKKAAQERLGIRTMTQEAFDLLPLDERDGIIIIKSEEETT